MEIYSGDYKKGSAQPGVTPAGAGAEMTPGRSSRKDRPGILLPFTKGRGKQELFFFHFCIQFFKRPLHRFNHFRNKQIRKICTLQYRCSVVVGVAAPASIIFHIKPDIVIRQVVVGGYYKMVTCNAIRQIITVEFEPDRIIIRIFKIYFLIKFIQCAAYVVIIKMIVGRPGCFEQPVEVFQYVTPLYKFL